MSGHSKWANIKHRKAAQDAKRSGVFTKLARNVALAAQAGPDPITNFRLKIAIDRAKAENLPKDKIEKAIARGSGQDKDAAREEEIIYELYGPGQTAWLIQVVTDNRNRTLGEVKNILKEHGGKLAENGSVNWQFDSVGEIFIKKESLNLNDEEFELKILETNAQSYENNEDRWRIITSIDDLEKVKNELEKLGLIINQAQIGFQAKNSVDFSSLDSETQTNFQNLYEALNNQADVMEIWNNVK